MFKHILLPTDGSELSGQAIAKCIAFARSIGAKVTGFHAVHEFPLLAYGAYEETGDGAPVSKADYEREAVARAQSALAAIDAAARDAGVECECLQRSASHPFAAIVAVAEERGCDLIFMASHGRKGLEGLLIGSETTRVLTHSRIPVLVYR